MFIIIISNFIMTVIEFIFNIQYILLHISTENIFQISS